MDDNAEVTPDKPHEPLLRIAIVSTPRSGNTWLRRLLATTYAIEERAAHDPADINWSELPSRVLLQLHWHNVAPFVALLKQHQFRVVALSRHPLDVLISILHFAPHEPDTARWLAGEGGNETQILNVSPCSSDFLEYATGPRAAALLSVSREWWQAPGTHRLRYEDLVADPAGELERLGNAIGYPPPPARVAEAIAANSMEALRAKSSNRHFWRGQPDHWKSLLPPAAARRIAGAHAASFSELGYECNPDECLDGDRAEANWVQFH